MSNDNDHVALQHHQKMEHLRAQFRQLRHRYLQQLPETMESIGLLWALISEQQWSRETVQTLIYKLHSLSGTGATFGLTTLSQSARAFEVYLQAMLERYITLTDQHFQEMEGLYANLHHAYVVEVDIPSLSLPADPSESVELDTDEQPEIPAITSQHRLIFLLVQNQTTVRDLIAQIGYFGYTVQVFSDTTSFNYALSQVTPTAIIRDTALLTDELPMLETHVAPFSHIPTIFLAQQGDFQSRLKAVRAGGHAYFIFPFDVSAVIDKLDELTIRREMEPHRILIVEDEKTLAEYYLEVLRRAGMKVVAITDPFSVMRPLFEFNPDLILMDVFMPGCTGLEVATIIRQQEAFVGVPIVFLSAETRREKQLIAMHYGGDDFLTKPITQEHLISAITSRVQRSRAMRASMVRDGLTGLLNHTTIKEHLDREVKLSRRRLAQVTLALIDLDHFKRVNDTYGHYTGDRVLKSLSRLLQQRLRRTDIIGRYGGEEFAVIMPDTSTDYAVRVLNQIREGFANIRQYADGNEFAVTFSCGIAGYPGYESAPQLVRAADRALYLAKHQGRNRIVVAPSVDRPLGLQVNQSRV
ncbi:MAG: diguanylate cyclase [Chloroflexaceae bacterium]|nr:diguanylate cyclase [Chloroflexaceae bacterium]NJO04728.1 diguanylate cyclase [Chloroflexaceae bacterium]